MNNLIKFKITKEAQKNIFGGEGIKGKYCCERCLDGSCNAYTDDLTVPCALSVPC